MTRAFGADDIKLPYTANAQKLRFLMTANTWRRASMTSW